ncbi:MAG: metal ABC transporter ATP-binding protein [Marinilabiliaceae bacterium]
MNKDALVTFHDVSAGYAGREVVSHVSFEVDRNTILALEGPNGSGKTTIVKVLLGLLAPLHGHVIRRPGLSVGYLPQVPTADLDFPITVTDVILMGARPHGLSLSRAHRQRAAELISFAGLDKVANSAIGRLSGGQRQRALLCRALMAQPDVLVLDEPVTYLDSESEEGLYSLIRNLSGSMGIVLVSHNHAVAQSLATQTVEFNRSGNAPKNEAGASPFAVSLTRLVK